MIERLGKFGRPIAVGLSSVALMGAAAEGAQAGQETKSDEPSADLVSKQVERSKNPQNYIAEVVALQNQILEEMKLNPDVQIKPGDTPQAINYFVFGSDPSHPGLHDELMIMTLNGKIAPAGFNLVIDTDTKLTEGRPLIAPNLCHWYIILQPKGEIDLSDGILAHKGLPTAYRVSASGGPPSPNAKAKYVEYSQDPDRVEKAFDMVFARARQAMKHHVKPAALLHKNIK